MRTPPAVEKQPRSPGEPHQTQGQVFTVTAKSKTRGDNSGDETRIIEIECNKGGGRTCVDPVEELDKHLEFLPTPPQSASIHGDRESLGFDEFGRVVKHLGEKGISFEPNESPPS